MTEQEERAYIRESVGVVAEVSGAQPVGWHGPEYRASTRTPNLLAEAGIRYVCDWPNDEQPYIMRVADGSLVSIPVLLDLDDVISHYVRHVPIMRYGQLLKEAFDILRRDGQESGRLMAITLHPWLMGQPFRVRYLDEALAYICGSGDVWRATGREVLDWYTASTDGRHTLPAAADGGGPG
jgi:peptidoglycan/xylan/chitin deacetylase (PgdA/CDA1 family)